MPKKPEPAVSAAALQRRLPANQMNPEGIFSGMALRNVVTDGSFVPTHEDRKPRGRAKLRDDE